MQAEKFSESQLVSQVSPIVEQANQIVVTEQTIDGVSGFLRQIKGQQKKINEFFAPLISSAHQTHKQLCTRKKQVETPLFRAEASIKSKISVYLQEQEQIRLAEEAKLREIQRKEDEERRLAQAEMAEKAGENGLAEQILEEEAATPALVIPKVINPEGISTRKTWHVEITDLKALVRAASEGRVALSYLLPNEKALRQTAVALKEEFKCPGVRVYSKSSVATRI